VKPRQATTADIGARRSGSTAQRSPRLVPHSPRACMSHSTVQRAMAWPPRCSDSSHPSSSTPLTEHRQASAILLAALATLVAAIKLRPRKELWIGSGILTVLLVLEIYLGGLIRDGGQDSLTAVHIPLVMALMGLVVRLPLRASRRT